MLRHPRELAAALAAVVVVVAWTRRTAGEAAPVAATPAEDAAPRVAAPAEELPPAPEDAASGQAPRKKRRRAKRSSSADELPAEAAAPPPAAPAPASPPPAEAPPAAAPAFAAPPSPEGGWMHPVARRVTRKQVQSLIEQARREQATLIEEQKKQIATLARASSADECEPAEARDVAALEKLKTHNDLLKSQLKRAGVTAIDEVVSFEEAKVKLRAAAARLLGGDGSLEDEREMERWDAFLRVHPEKAAEEARAAAAWRRDHAPANAAALRVVRGFVPPAMTSTGASLAQLEGRLPKAAAKRVFANPALWLTRASKGAIAKVHIADLRSRYHVQSLSLLELRAVYAALPEAFDDAEKASWRADLERKLERMAKETLPPAKRAPAVYGAAGAWADGFEIGGAGPAEDLDDALLPFGADDDALPEPPAKEAAVAAPRPAPPPRAAPPPRRQKPDVFAAIRAKRGDENKGKASLLAAIERKSASADFTSPRRAMANLLQNALAKRRVD
ncbi:hypothetical protein AURANDRAFT_64471 [Aureococcus anophagefferens]|uniref:Uncharacterized protein n=1 Tax=Aureococcus anophagefferens TaxID=44056 RepID=F0YA97_AURAN|nr:hypothetical protein AURANDRAFT_64471 [Aureococcus anophagefferens]EGB07893.1 hypothetical protein AURANDRAFT_64471 [Aureococcus anophagefferens]|eukprot:XP_009037270.1 hypothetical protein AURANDRAFT_64471 [Aureococcus anophagefferens]